MDSLAFLFLIAVGAMVQTITGFAMGLIVMGGVALFGLIDMTAAAAVVSLVSLLNVSVALRRTYRFIHWQLVAAVLLGMAPMIFVGVALLDYLSAENLLVLKSLLGIVIVSAGFLLASKPHPYEDITSAPVAGGFGMAAGLMGGLYGAGGAPVAYLMYRQPLLIQTVRASLLSIFAMSTVIRTGFVAVEGHLTEQVFYLVLLSMPVVVLATLVAGQLAPKLQDHMVQRLALWLLILIGLSLIGSGMAEMLL